MDGEVCSTCRSEAAAETYGMVGRDPTHLKM
jgi:hypothetical protein